MSKTYTPAIIKNLHNSLVTMIISNAILKLKLQNEHIRLSKTVNHYLNRR